MINWQEELEALGVRLVVKVESNQGTAERPATLQDVRDALQAIGLDVTTRGNVCWDQDYPARAKHLRIIRQLEQQLRSLQAKLPS